MNGINIIIKIYDFIDYVVNRGRNLAAYHVSLLKRYFILGTKIESILIVRLGSLGDVVRSTIVIHLLKTKYPDAKIDILTSELNLPVLKHNKDLNRIYSVSELNLLSSYDWIINLQNPDPPTSFLSGTEMDYPSLVRYISQNIPHKLMTGRRYECDKERRQTNILYCRTELEEILLTALFRYDERMLALSQITLDDGLAKTRVSEMVGRDSWIKPPVGIFFGALNDIDRGMRTFSLEYLFSLADQLGEYFTVIFFGQSNHRTLNEIKQYDEIISSRTDFIDMIDKTNLEELLHLISFMKVIVATDSSPIHFSMALGIPVVGLYSKCSRFRISPVNKTSYYILLNAFDPCFDFNYRWKFFCDACSNKHSDAYLCNLKNIPNHIEHIPICKITEAVRELSD